MLTIRGLSLVKLLSKAFARFSKKEKPQSEVLMCTGNPWQHNLERLATEHKPMFESIEQRDELSGFVNTLTQAAYEAQSECDANRAVQDQVSQATAAKRAGDRTVQNMKSWWQQSLGTANEETAQSINVSELPGKPRLLKRWFE